MEISQDALNGENKVYEHNITHSNFLINVIFPPLFSFFVLDKQHYTKKMEIKIKGKQKLPTI